MTIEMLPLQHRPVRPPRQTFIGECVYASMWEALMNTPFAEHEPHEEGETRIDRLLHAMDDPIVQRYATVAASVVCWLGTNVGRAMLHRAERERDRGHWSEHEAYLIAWTLENTRRLGVNSGIRTIEYLMAPESTYVRDHHILGWNRYPLSELPDISGRDLEVAEHLMYWLAEHDGQSFIRQCEAEIKRLMDEHSLAERARWLRENYTAPEVL